MEPNIYRFIYVVTNKRNGKCYVGQHVTNRLNDGYAGSGAILWKAYKKHGKENFIMEHIYYAFDQDELDAKETFFIHSLNSHIKKNGYNMNYGGKGQFGYKFSKAIRRLRSRQTKGTNNPMYGKTHSPESRQKMSESRKANGCGIGEKNGMFGKKRDANTIIAGMKNSAKQKMYRVRLTDPLGNAFEPVSLKTFCVEHSLPYSTVIAQIDRGQFVSRRKESRSFHGWTIASLQEI